MINDVNNYEGNFHENKDVVKKVGRLTITSSSQSSSNEFLRDLQVGEGLQKGKFTFSKQGHSSEASSESNKVYSSPAVSQFSDNSGKFVVNASKSISESISNFDEFASGEYSSSGIIDYKSESGPIDKRQKSIFDTQIPQFLPTKKLSYDNAKHLELLEISKARATFLDIEKSGKILYPELLGVDKDFLLAHRELIAHCIMYGDSKDRDFDYSIRNHISVECNKLPLEDKQEILSAALKQYPESLQSIVRFCKSPESFDDDSAIMAKMMLEIFRALDPRVQNAVYLASGLNLQKAALLMTWNSSKV